MGNSDTGEDGGENLCYVNQINDSKVFYGVCNTCQHLIHLHADRVCIVAKTSYDYPVFFLHGTACATLAIIAKVIAWRATA